jgi:hypothetical protein
MPSLLESPKLNRKQVAARLGVCLLTVDRWARYGIRGRKLPRLKVGGKTLFLESDVERWVRDLSNRHEPAFDADADADRAEAELAAMGLSVPV